MTQELVMTLVANDCECIETGECTCEEDACICVCECVGCSQEIISDCACGGNCGCGTQEYSSPLHEYETDNDSSYTWR